MNSILDSNQEIRSLAERIISIEDPRHDLADLMIRHKDQSEKMVFNQNNRNRSKVLPKP